MGIAGREPVLEKIYDSWLINEEYYPELTGDELKSYYQQLSSGLTVTASWKT
jgi:hypothetical protein